MDFKQISSYVTETLTGSGVHAVDAWDGKVSCEHCVVVVSLGECTVASSGMGDYLGQMDVGEGLEDVYGKRCMVKIDLGFYAPGKGGEKLIQKEVQEVLHLLGEKEQTLRMLRFVAGTTAMDTASGRLKRDVTLEFGLYLYNLEGSAETFMDIDIKGEMKNASK